VSPARKALALLLALALHVPLFLHQPAGLQQGDSAEGRATQTGITLKLAGKPQPASNPAVAPPTPTPPPLPEVVRPSPATTPATPTPQRESATTRESSAHDDEEGSDTDVRDGGQVMGLAGASLDGTQDDEIERYLGLIRSRVQALIEYPQQARLRRQQGTVTVSFSINNEGRADDIEVLNSSGSPLLDQAAVRLFQRLRLPPPAPELLPSLQQRSIPVVYELR
jgi:periplasmic protein TonB